MDKVSDFEEAVTALSMTISLFKELGYNHRPISVGIEGLSQSGKSSFADSLERQLSEMITIDGDKFQNGRKNSMEVYYDLIEKFEKGKKIPMDFYNDLWRYDQMRSALLDPIRNFNPVDSKEIEVCLKGMIDPKTKFEEDAKDESYLLNKKSIVIVPAMYLRQIEEFDFIVTLKVTSKTSIERKLKKNEKRDTEVTRKMVDIIENPAMEYHLKTYKVESEIVLDTNDFNRIFQSPL